MKYSSWTARQPLAIAMLLVFSVGAVADLEEGQWYVAPMFSTVNSDEDRGTENGLSGGQLIFGRAIGDASAFEINLNANNLDSNGSGNNTQLRGMSFDFLKYKPDQEFFAPYILAGIGFQGSDNSNAPNSSDITGSLGLGFMGWLASSDRTSLRAEARFKGSMGNPHFNDFFYSFGFQSQLGEVAPPPPGDSDGDGVTDDRDRCPGTPIGTAVDASGCKLDGDDDGDGVKNSMDKCPNTAKGATVDRNGCKVKEKDSDGDGVVDSKDQCPNTIRGAKVDANGCELDSDGDGVVDSQDRCPNTTAGVRVDVNGCEITEKISLPGVQFELNSATLKSESFDVLNDAAATLNKHSDIMVEVAGHTDSSGADSYNMSLSDKRARSVAEYLAGRGVSMSRMQSKGYGETQPIADNSTAGGRALNRRVELRILNQ